MSKQDDLINFVNDPKNIDKAVEGSMDKRNQVMTKPNTELRALFYSSQAKLNSSADIENFIAKIAQLITQEKIKELQDICRDNWQCPIPEKYMLDRIAELKSELKDK